MKRFNDLRLVPGALTGLAALLMGGLASAQQPAPAAPPAPPAAQPAPEPPPPPVDAAPAEPAPPPVAPPPADVAPPPMPAPAPEPGTAPEPAPAAKPWYDAIAFSAFADAYASVNYNFPKPQVDKNKFRAYDTANGMSLAWAGVNASYDPDPVGGTISLRFGPQTNYYNSGTESQYGLQYVKQAFATWRPGGKDGPVTLDFGKFDTIVGAEVADSYLNQNYTRGLLYWLAQPLFHTGVRAAYQATEAVGIKAMVVNGWNNTIDNNSGKTYGLQLALTPVDGFAAYLSWIGGPEQADTTTVPCAAGTIYNPSSGCVASAGAEASNNTVDQGGANDLKAWKHLVDLVVTYTVNDNLGLVFNADYATQGTRTGGSAVDHQKYYGAMLGARYQLSDVWAIGARGEYIKDSDGMLTGVSKAALASGTLTIEAKPTANLILRLDTRGDFAANDEAKDIFDKKLRDTASNQITNTLGVVVVTN